MTLKTNILLLISVGIIACTTVLGSYWDSFGLGKESSIFLAYSFIIGFGLNIAGVIFALTEKKKSKGYLIGLIGHIGLIILFFLVVTYAWMTMG